MLLLVTIKQQTADNNCKLGFWLQLHFALPTFGVVVLILSAVRYYQLGISAHERAGS